ACGLRRGAGRQERRGQSQRDGSHADLRCGVSTTTVVALTTATANEPGRRPSSRTASELIRETTRCGPHCSSTCAITVSVTTSVTRPTNRLRADRFTSDGSATSAAYLRARAASSSPSITARPAASVVAVNSPALTQRRTVSSLTASSRAASEIRYCGTKWSLDPNLRNNPRLIVRKNESAAHGAEITGAHPLPSQLPWGCDGHQPRNPAHGARLRRRRHGRPPGHPGVDRQVRPGGHGSTRVADRSMQSALQLLHARGGPRLAAEGGHPHRRGVAAGPARGRADARRHRHPPDRRGA